MSNRELRPLTHAHEGKPALLFGASWSVFLFFVGRQYLPPSGFWWARRQPGSDTGKRQDVANVRRQVVTGHVFAKNNSVSLLAITPLACLQTACRQPAKRLVVPWERETGFEPATACLEGRVSQDRRSFGIDRLLEPIKQVHVFFTQY
jgi:hypothetical protein